MAGLLRCAFIGEANPGILKGNIFVGNFRAGRATTATEIVRRSGLIVLFGACSSSHGACSGTAAVATSAEHPKITGNNFKTGALLALFVLPFARLNTPFDKNQRTLL